MDGGVVQRLESSLGSACDLVRGRLPDSRFGEDESTVQMGSFHRESPGQAAGLSFFAVPCGSLGAVRLAYSRKILGERLPLKAFRVSTMARDERRMSP